MTSPIPPDWETGGVPLIAVAAFSEGACPVHLSVPLSEGMVRYGGKLGMPVRWVPGGWCDLCETWWHQASGALSAVWVCRP